MRDENGLSAETAIMRLQQLLENNKHLMFVQKLKSFHFDVSDESLLLVFSHLFVNNCDDSLTLDTLMAHCDNERLEQVEHRMIGF